MQTKIASALAVLLCMCTVVNSFPADDFKSVLCEKTVIDGVTEEDCDDGTGVSSEPGQADNTFMGFDSKGRRVVKIAGDDGTCYIYPQNSKNIPTNVQKMTLEENMYPVEVTDAEVLKSVEKWCGTNVLLLQDNTPAEGRQKRAASKCRYRVRVTVYRNKKTGNRIVRFRLYKVCPKE